MYHEDDEFDEDAFDREFDPDDDDDEGEDEEDGALPPLHEEIDGRPPPDPQASEFERYELEDEDDDDELREDSERFLV